jgi:hypothetical protein
MATQVRIELNKAGIREAALTSQDVRDMIAKFSEQVAGRARSGGDTIETFHGGDDRARSYVWLAESNSAANEAKNRILGRALGRLE